jgi:CheY-like chemotaxis protein
MTLADCTVLVVEDHEFQRRTTLQMLANLGVGALLEAADGDAALALLSEADIIVCDLDMPAMDGVEFLRHVSETRAGTAIVIASGLEESVLRSAERTARGFGLEVLGAIRKPLTARRLLEAVGLHRPRAAERPESPVAELEVRLVVALSDGRVTAVELRGATSMEAADLAAGRVPVATRSATGDVPAEFDSSVGVTLVVDRVSDDLLDLDPARVTISLLDGPHLQAAPLALLTRLRVHGFKLGVADFGAGRATLNELAKLPLTEVQLAASTVQNATSTPHGAEVLAATVEALHQQGVSVVGAGCDSKAEWLLLLELGVEKAQGAYLP